VRLSNPALETLAVVAYRQPVLRAQIEAIRGVQSGELLRQLMERDLVRIVGRSPELGRPFQYGTTKRFLRIFGLRQLDDLPRVASLRLAAKTVAARHEETTPEPSGELDTVTNCQQEEPDVRISAFQETSAAALLDDSEMIREEETPPTTFAAKDEEEDVEDDEDEDDDEEDDDEDYEDDDLEEEEWEEVDDEEEEEEEEFEDEDDDWEDDDEDDDDWDDDEEEDWEEGDEE
jgi:segregation and condensation protein B